MDRLKCSFVGCFDSVTNTAAEPKLLTYFSFLFQTVNLMHAQRVDDQSKNQRDTNKQTHQGVFGI